MISIAVTILFIVVKIMEMKFVDKEQKPMKFLVRDAMIVCTCAFVPIFAFFQMNLGVEAAAGEATQIFTDKPEF